MIRFTVTTGSRAQMLDIGGRVEAAVQQSGLRDGVCLVFVPHTTAGITINEGADPSVRRDMLMELDKLVPWSDGYEHAEGNSAAHLKASLLGSSVTIPISDGRLVLGTWQAVYFCEFDGPRQREVLVQVLPAA